MDPPLPSPRGEATIWLALLEVDSGTPERSFTLNMRSAPKGLAPLLAALATVGPFSIDTYLPAFPAMGKALAASPVEVQQTLTAYLVPFAFMMLWHGALSDALGRRRVLLWAYAIYAAASVFCVFVGSIEGLWFGRALQGLSAGAGMVVGRAIVRDVLDGPAAQRLMAHIGMMFALAPALAPVLGGWIHAFFDWHAIFVFLALYGVTLWLAIWRYLPETLPVLEGGDPGREVIVEAAVNRIFASGSESEVARLMFRDGHERTLRAGELVSGAVLAKIAQSACRRACERAYDGDDLYLTVTDILTATGREIDEMAVAITPRNCRSYVGGLPDDVDVVRVDRVRRRTSRCLRSSGRCRASVARSPAARPSCGWRCRCRRRSG